MTSKTWHKAAFIMLQFINRSVYFSWLGCPTFCERRENKIWRRFGIWQHWGTVNSSKARFKQGNCWWDLVRFLASVCSATIIDFHVLYSTLQLLQILLRLVDARDKIQSSSTTLLENVQEDGIKNLDCFLFVGSVRSSTSFGWQDMLGKLGCRRITSRKSSGE